MAQVLTLGRLGAESGEKKRLSTADKVKLGGLFILAGGFLAFITYAAVAGVSDGGTSRRLVDYGPGTIH